MLYQNNLNQITSLNLQITRLLKNRLKIVEKWESVNRQKSTSPEE